MTHQFLHGIRVVDLSQFIPGPYASLLLADLGADVVKVEPPAGDPMRQFPPSGDAGSVFHAVMNGGKRIVLANLKDARERDCVLELIARADVLLESYRPGVLERLGLGRAELAAANPRLIHCALSGYGQTGPYARRSGHDLGYMAIAGGLVISGTPEAPVATSPPVADYASAQLAATSIAAALFGRSRTGKGTFIDIGITDVVLGWQSWLLTDAFRKGSETARGRSSTMGGHAAYRIYRTADDRFLTLAGAEERYWRIICEAIGRPDLLARFDEPVPQDDLMGDLGTVFASRPLAHWNAVLGSLDCCYEPVLELTEIAEHPQIRDRAMLAFSDSGGPVVEALFPAWIEGAPPQRRAAPVEIALATAIASWQQARSP